MTNNVIHTSMPCIPPDRQDPTLRRTTITRSSNDAQEVAETERPRRRLGVCEGEAHAIMLEEMLKGANVVISGDSGKLIGKRDGFLRACLECQLR